MCLIFVKMQLAANKLSRSLAGYKDRLRSLYIHTIRGCRYFHVPSCRRFPKLEKSNFLYGSNQKIGHKIPAWR